MKAAVQKRWFDVYRFGRRYRAVIAENAGAACDLVRAEDSNAEQFFRVELYIAVIKPKGGLTK